MSSRFDYADPSSDDARCDALSLDLDEERDDEQAEIAADLADQAEADAALQREFQPFKKAPAA